MTVGLVLLLAAALAACGTMRSVTGAFKDRRTEYKSASTLPPLEVPPDLAPPGQNESLEMPTGTGEGPATYSSYRANAPAAPGTQSELVLVQPANVTVQRDGNREWLVVKGEPDQVWTKVRNFWVKSGFVLKVDDPKLGILETDWAENRADIPQDFIRRTLGRLFDQIYSSSTRDKFRVRLERGTEPGTTEVYLTHRGMEEVAKGDSTFWQPRREDPELEAEMLKRLMVSLGVEEKKAGTMIATRHEGSRAVLGRDSEGNSTLAMNEDFSRAWRRVGLSLDKVGFTVEDRDRSRGIYYVRYIEPDEGDKKGFLSKLAFWKGKEKPNSDEYVVRLIGEGDATGVTVVDKQGKPANSKTAQKILKLLYEDLK